MILDQLNQEQRDILTEIGHFHILLESHQIAADFCRDQLKQLRAQLEQTEASRASG